MPDAPIPGPAAGPAPDDAEIDAEADVLIVGSGLMGAIVARLLREDDPGRRLLMVDGGAPIGGTPGRHLHDVDDPALWARYNERVSVGIQGLYTGARVSQAPTGGLGELEAGMFHLLAFGEDAEAMPAAALAWNAGGMGVHWTAATPWPAGSEVFDPGDPERFAEELATAQRVLEVAAAPLGPTAPGEVVLELLRRRYPAPPGRAAQAMPMAVRPAAAGRLPRSSPATIFPPLGGAPDPAFALRSSTLAVALLVEEGRVAGVRVREVASGAERELRAAHVVVCADAVRTPQLLFASGIRPPALGRYLNEHAFVTARVLLDLERFGLRRDELPLPREGEFATDSLWLPQNGPAQPFHGQIMNTSYVDEAGRPIAHSVGLSLYSPVESRPENRLVLSETERDLAGLPRIRVEFSYSARDRELIERALAEVESLARELGPFDPETERALLPPGSSLHLTGTVRSGTTDDGTSVCDPDGRVWGFENLYLAGNGVVPTPVVANATLTGAVTAVRAARAVARRRVAVPDATAVPLARSEER